MHSTSTQEIHRRAELGNEKVEGRSPRWDTPPVDPLQPPRQREVSVSSLLWFYGPQHHPHHRHRHTNQESHQAVDAELCQESRQCPEFSAQLK